jgi:hypothetical protein
MSATVQINRYDDEQNGMNEYERRTTEWNQSDQVQEMRARRNAAINNTVNYHTGNRIHHLRAIQMNDPILWNEIFGREILNPILREYAQASIDWANDDTNTLLFAGQMDVSLLMQENFRPGVHIAIFFIYLGPHRHFHDGHAIQMEFGEGSHTHQTVARIFDLSDRAIVLQATEYQMLSYLADDDEVLELLHNCFLQPDFAPMRFVFVEPTPTNDGEGGDDDGYYIVNLNAGNNHRWHNFADDHHDHHDHDHDNYQHQHQQPPPPPLVNEDFAEIYRRNLAEDDNEEFIDNQYQEPNRRNIIQYMYNDIDYDSDDSDDSDHETIEAQG